MLLEQAIYGRRGTGVEALLDQSDRGTHFLSIRYTEPLAEAGIEPSVGSLGGPYDTLPKIDHRPSSRREVIQRKGA